MTTVVSILLVIASLIVVTAILLQPAKSGVSALGGSSQSVFGSTGGTTFLFRVTMWTGAFIMIGCLFLSWYKIRSNKSSVIDNAVIVPSAATPTTAPATSAPAQSEVPAASPSAPTGN